MLQCDVFEVSEIKGFFYYFNISINSINIIVIVKGCNE